MLKRNGYPCGPDRARQTRWSEFLRSHWESLAAIDFFTTEIYILTGLTRYMVLVSIHYATRKVEVVGIIRQAHAEWMSQMARNLVEHFSGFLKDKKYLIHDRDPLFTEKFRKILKSSGVKPIRTTPMSPHLNCVMERFVRSMKTEALDRMLIFGERPAVAEAKQESVGVMRRRCDRELVTESCLLSGSTQAGARDKMRNNDLRLGYGHASVALRSAS